MEDSIDSITVDTNNFLMVEGIENWIETLCPAQTENDQDLYSCLRMVDTKTGAKFFICKINDGV